MKFFFAGAENKSIIKALYDNNVKNVLLSYYYVKKKNVNIGEVLGMFENVVIDSGAFTMFHKKDIDKSIHAHEKYLDGYLDLLYQYSGKFFWVANYDIDIFVGYKVIDRWNRLFESLEKENQTVCYVAHDFKVPYRRLREYFNRYDYIGIGTDEKLRKDNVGFLSQVYHLARTKKKKTHGFAMTNFVSQTNFPFYSVDSTTYLGGRKFGSTYVWNGSFFETWDTHQKHRRKQLKMWCDKWGINHNDFMNDKTEAVDSFNIRAWLENENNFNKKTKNKQWWLYNV